MFIVLVITTALLALLSVASATMKLKRDPRSVDSIHGTVGVPLAMLPVLAALELAGAAGILIGLWVEPLGIAAACGLVAYFLGAVIAHLRVHDTSGATAPLAPLALSTAVLVLRLVTL